MIRTFKMQLYILIYKQALSKTALFSRIFYTCIYLKTDLFDTFLSETTCKVYIPVNRVFKLSNTGLS